MAAKKEVIKNPLGLKNIHDVYKPEIVYVQTLESLISIVPIFQQYSAVTLDSETTGLDTYKDCITTLQLSYKAGLAYIIDVLEIGQDSWVYIEQILKDKTIHLINADFDIRMMRCFYKKEPWKAVVDIMLLSQVYYQGRLDEGHSLSDCIARELELYLPKDEQGSNWSDRPLSNEQLQYAAMDVECLWHLREKLVPKIKEDGNLWNAALTEVTFQKALLHCERTGMPVNVTYAKSLVDLLKQDTDQLEKEIQQGLGDPNLNIRSTKQLPAALKRYLGVELDSTAKNVLKPFATPEFPVIQKILKYKASKKPMQYVEGILKSVRNVQGDYGFVHTKYWQLASFSHDASDDTGGSVVGRLSSVAPNLQNPDRDSRVRHMFEAPPGYFLIDADWSQLHGRIYAYFANDDELSGIFIRDEDWYTATAKALLEKSGVNWDSLTPEEQAGHRQKTKAVCLGFLFGMGANRFVSYAYDTYGAVFTLEEAQEIRRAFFKLFDELEEKHRYLAQKCKYTKYSHALGGHTIYHQYDKYNDYLNWTIIATEAEIFKTAASLVFKEIVLETNYEVQICNFVHDEIMLLVPEKYVNHKSIDGLALYVDHTNYMKSKKAKFTIVGELAIYQKSELPARPVADIKEFYPVWESDIALTLADCMKRGFEQFVKNVPCKVESVIHKSWDKLK